MVRVSYSSFVSKAGKQILFERRGIVGSEAKNCGHYLRRGGDDLELLADLGVEFAHGFKPGAGYDASESWFGPNATPAGAFLRDSLSEFLGQLMERKDDLPQDRER